MKRNIHIINIAVTASVWIVLSSFCTAVSASSIFIEKSKVKGGLVVHVGCGDGALVAALGKNKQLVIQG